MKALLPLALLLGLVLPAQAQGPAAPVAPAAPAPRAQGPAAAPPPAPAAAPAGPEASQPLAPAGEAPPASSPADEPAADREDPGGEPAERSAPEADAGDASDAGDDDGSDSDEFEVDDKSCEASARLPDAAEPPPFAPVDWTSWEMEGKLLDRAAVLHEVVDGAMRAHRPFTERGRREISKLLAALGYHLVDVQRVPRAGGAALQLHVQPLRLIRSVTVKTQVDLGLEDILLLKPFRTVILDDEVARRMRMRAGVYLPWDPAVRACELLREEQRIVEYLYDEGFFEAQAELSIEHKGDHAARIRVQLRLGPAYKLGQVTIQQAGKLALSQQEIRDQLGRDRNCLLTLPFRLVCDKRFTRAQHQAEIKQLTELYQKRGFPSVRIASSCLTDPKTSFDRLTKTVKTRLVIDERRRVDVDFEGHDPDRFTDDKLRSLLTFNEVGSANDVEAEASATAITTYLQGRGYFEARVTWKRERFSPADKIVFRISAGKPRRVQRVEFRGNTALSSEQLTSEIATRPYGSVVRLLGNAPPITAEQLEHDANRIIRAYRKRGYQNARIEIAAGPSPEALDSLALGMAQLASSRTDGNLYVRFTIDEGRTTNIRKVEVAFPVAGDTTGAAEDTLLSNDEDRALCDQILQTLSGKNALASPPLVRRQVDRCVADTQLIYSEERREAGLTAVRRLLGNQARPESTADLTPIDLSQTEVPLTFHVRNLRQRRVGRVLLRGNFRTRRDIILRELGLTQGQMLTADLASEAQSRLRATGLFNAVNVSYLHAEDASHAVVQVEERFDSPLQLDLEGGASYLNGRDINPFIKGRVNLPNLLGRGVNVDLAVTKGTQLFFIDSSLRIPRFLVHWSPVVFDTELSAFWHQQDTDRFGSLLTKGLTLASSRSWQRNSTGGHPARALSTGLRYDFRVRDRQLETIRPAGTDSSETRIPVTTRAGALALTFEWEQRVTRTGTLSPLAPEDGFRLQASVSFASPYLLGQDTFLKLGASAQVYWPVGSRLLVRTDLRYDHGIALGGEVVLPEVERFFAGGDSTVRGYDEDRLATEIVEQLVPPLSGVKQVRVLAAGGNIRAISSIDGQVRMTKSLAAAMFLDAGIITNDWRAARPDDVRPGTGMALRALLPVGAISLEYAIPLRTKLGDDPRGRIHFGFAMRFD